MIELGDLGARRKLAAAMPPTTLANLLHRALRWCGWFIVLAPLFWASPAAYAQDRMSEIVENVRANEALYRDIEIVLRKTYRFGKPTYGNSQSTTREETSRFVYQNGLIYFYNEELAKRLDSDSHRSDTLQGYDGLETRVLEQHRFARLYQGRWEDPRLFRPHTRFLNRAYVTFPLSVYLQGSSALRDHPAAGPYARFFNLTVSFEKEEPVDDLRCFKIRAEAWADPSFPTETTVRFLWLAPERNYLPVKIETYRPYTNADSPIEMGRVAELREIGPGVWFPIRDSLVLYEDEWLDANKVTVANTEEYAVEKAALHPNYDISLFRGIVFPNEITVDVFKNGKLIRVDWRGEHGDTVEAGPRLWLLAGGFVIVAGAAIAGFLYYRAGRLPWPRPARRTGH